jgi:ubiquinone/menaquinone biosynthesis C-methylase UbiE
MTRPSYALDQASFPEMYERWLVGPLFRPWAELIVTAVELSSGDRVLDVACGTGIVARCAAEVLGDAAYIVGVDISSDMLAVAHAVAPTIDWRTGDAGALPLREGEQFDAVICQQGLQFFTDKPGAAAQMRRALGKNGRLAVATWRSDDESPFLQELRQIAERHLGSIADQRYSFGDTDALEALLRRAGFHEVRSRTVSRTANFEDGAPFLRLNTMAFVGMSSVGRAMGEQERKDAIAAIVSDSAPVLQSYSTESGLAFEMRANVATAKG